MSPSNGVDYVSIVGAVFEDIGGRRLTVTAVDMGNPLGRQIQGIIEMQYEVQTLKDMIVLGDKAPKRQASESAPYATDAKTFETIWLNKAPRWEGTT